MWRRLVRNAANDHIEFVQALKGGPRRKRADQRRIAHEVAARSWRVYVGTAGRAVVAVTTRRVPSAAQMRRAGFATGAGPPGSGSIGYLERTGNAPHAAKLASIFRSVPMHVLQELVSASSVSLIPFLVGLKGSAVHW